MNKCTTHMTEPDLPAAHLHARISPLFYAPV